MNIKRAKEEIKHTIDAYHLRGADGKYRIPVIRQRPVLLMGPPGIGKNQIMEQVAEECGLPLLSYPPECHWPSFYQGKRISGKDAFCDGIYHE